MEKPEQSPSCPFCQDPINEGQSVVCCPKCKTPHHANCWKEYGKCSTYGCDGWQTLAGKTADESAPFIGKGDIDDLFDSGYKSASDEPLCINCGRPARRGQLICGRCHSLGSPVRRARAAPSSDIAPEQGAVAVESRGKADIDALFSRGYEGVSAAMVCSECGEPVKAGQQVCGRCRGARRGMGFENCAGPSLIVLGSLIAIVVLLLKGLF